MSSIEKDFIIDQIENIEVEILSINDATSNLRTISQLIMQ